MTEKKKPNPYEKCKLFVENESFYGSFKRWDKDGMFVIDQLNIDISNHLNSLKVRKHLNYNSICYYYYFNNNNDNSKLA